jgi:hypothetical protein
MKWEESNGRRGFRTRGIMFRIGGNTFYDQKNEIPISGVQKVWNRINGRIPYPFKPSPESLGKEHTFFTITFQKYRKTNSSS